MKKNLLLAHEELMKSQMTLSIAESEKAKDLREGMKVQLEENFQLEHTTTMLDAVAIEAHNSLQLWEKATNWWAQVNAVLGIGLGNIHRGKCSSRTHSRRTS